MIFVNLRGGLGNQLFQLGASLRLAKGEISNICLNTEYLGSRAFEISKWIDGSNLPAVIQRFEAGMLSNAEKTYLIKDPESGRNYVYGGPRADCNNLFRLTMGVAEKECSIHYRVGDYENIDVQQVLGMVNLSYVDRAISIIQHKYDQINIYSEPNDLLGAYSEKRGLTLKVNLSSDEVFSKLLKSETLVICNSSFSLSAAYLSNSLKTLFRPARWSRKYGVDSLTDSLDTDVRYVSNSFFKII